MLFTGFFGLQNGIFGKFYWFFSFVKFGNSIFMYIWRHDVTYWVLTDYSIWKKMPILAIEENSFEACLNALILYFLLVFTYVFLSGIPERPVKKLWFLSTLWSIFFQVSKIHIRGGKKAQRNYKNKRRQSWLTFRGQIM